MTTLVPWTASLSALGPITQETCMSVEALAPLLPGYTVKAKGPMPDAPDNSSLIARAEGSRDTALEFIGHQETGCVVTVRVFESGRIANAFVIGSAFSQTLLKPDRCFRGEGTMRDYVYASAENEPWLVYWLTSKAIAADASLGVPGEEILSNAEVAFISWVPLAPPAQS